MIPKFFIIGVSRGDFIETAKHEGVHHHQAFYCDSLDEAVRDATINADKGLMSIVCCTEQARKKMDLPESIRSVTAAVKETA